MNIFFSLVCLLFSGYCYSNEYSCSNGRCIDDDANCNGFDPCGDKSDCKLSSATITGIVIGVILAVIILGAAAGVLLRSLKKQNRRVSFLLLFFLFQ